MTWVTKQNYKIQRFQFFVSPGFQLYQSDQRIQRVGVHGVPWTRPRKDASSHQRLLEILGRSGVAELPLHPPAEPDIQPGGGGPLRVDVQGPRSELVRTS